MTATIIGTGLIGGSLAISLKETGVADRVIGVDQDAANLARALDLHIISGAATLDEGMKLGDLARYLMVSRQNLAGVVGRLERDGRVESAADPQDGRSRLVRMTASGRQVWQRQALPKIHAYYEQALDGFSTNDMVHTVHYLLKMLENMERIDAADGEDDE